MNANIQTYTFIEPIERICTWEIMSIWIIYQDANAIDALSEQVNARKSILLRDLELYPNNEQKIKCIEKALDKEIQYLKTKQLHIHLLDGSFDKFVENTQNDIKLFEFNNNTSVKRVLKYFNKDSIKQIEVVLTIKVDELNNKANCEIRFSDKFNMIDAIEIVTSIGFAATIQEGTKPTFKWLKNMFSTFLFDRKNLIKLIYTPLLMVQQSRLFYRVLIEQLEYLGGSFYLNADKDYSIPTQLANNLNIKKEYVKYILYKLKPYFSENQFKELNNLILRNEIPTIRICFLTTGSMLAYFFKELHSKNIIISTKNTSELFLEKHFDFFNSKTKENTPFSKALAHRYISTKDSLKGKETIDLSDMEDFIKNNENK
jgi:hypothetical protein